MKTALPKTPASLLQLATAIALTSACGSGTNHTPKPTIDPHILRNQSIRLSSSEGELNTLVANLASASTARNKISGDPIADTQSSVPEASSQEGSTNETITNETITNNQEQGVDEGDIIKNIDNHLVILRNGALYSVRVGEEVAPNLSASTPVPLDTSLTGGVWYDEMLVKGRNIYVIGYRYATMQGNNYNSVGATEINSFRLEADGTIQRLTQIFIESSDYYSSHNYASRMVDGKLMLYMPRYAFHWNQESSRLRIPYTLEYSGYGQFTQKSPLLGWRDIYLAPTATSNSYSLHTLAQCTLPETGEINCEARAFLGTWSKEFYVTADSIFLWLQNIVFKWDFSDLSLLAHASQGHTLDQFSFKQDNTHLHVIATLPQPIQSGPVVLTSYPLAGFDDKAQQPLASIPSQILLTDNASAYVSRNRFVGDWAYVARQHWDSQYQLEKTEIVVAKALSTTRHTHTLLGRISRIEPLSDSSAFLVAGRHVTDDNTTTNIMSLKVFDADSPDWDNGWMRLEGLTEGESRSHGFFFKPADTAGEGTLGLPVMNPQSNQSSNNWPAGWWWGTGISNIAFFKVSAESTLTHLGTVSNNPSQEQACTTSCVDWYGNTRPVFLGTRTYALMGGEFQEVGFADDTITELHERVILAPNR